MYISPFPIILFCSYFGPGTLAAPSISSSIIPAEVAVPLTKIKFAEADGVFVSTILNNHTRFIVSKYSQNAVNYAHNTGKRITFPASRILVNASRPSSQPADDNEVRETRITVASLEHQKRADQGGETLASQDGLMWIGPMTVGSNAQPFMIDFDTGSSDTWVSSTDCSADCGGHKRYNAATSSTSEVTDQSFSIAYADGSTSSGTVVIDTVSVAGLAASRQKFAQVTAASESFATEPEDGIMGLSFQSISSINAPPFFDTLVTQRRVKESIFAFRLAESGAELYLGGVNSRKYTGLFEWSRVDSDAYWVGFQLRLTSRNNHALYKQIAGQIQSATGIVAVDGVEILQNSFILDTGSTLIIAPTSEAAAFYSQVPDSEPYEDGYYTFPCDQSPLVTFKFNKRAWPVAAYDFNLGTIGSNRCVGAVVGLDVGVSAWILGDAFLMNVYSAFDTTNNRIGLARVK